MKQLILLVTTFCVLCGPAPTMANVAYGPHKKQVMDFWKAASDKPTPLLFFIHGGGWMGGSKAGVTVAPYLAAGISVVSIEYRFIPEATTDGVVPPVKGPLHDAARALQFVRSKAAAVEPGQDAHRRKRRFRGRVFLALARVPSRHG